MKRTVTYGVRHLTEWLTYVTADKMHLPVHFVGGAVSGYGVTPARYVTDSPLMQYLIEQSVNYKNGLIRRLEVKEIPESDGKRK